MDPRTTNTTDLLPLAFIGDIHWDGLDHLRHALAGIEGTVQTFIQVGDFALYNTPQILAAVDEMLRWHAASRGVDPDRSQLLFIDGNRDWHDLLAHDAPGPVRLSPHVTYIPRGVALTLHGIRVGFLGGATSPSRPTDREGVNRWAQESITCDQWYRAMDMGPVDILVTHEAIPAVFDAIKASGALRHSGQAFGQMDRDAVEAVVDEVRPLLHVHGHYHHFAQFGPDLPGGIRGVRTLGLGGVSSYGCSATVTSDLRAAFPSPAAPTPDTTSVMTGDVAA